MESSLPYLDPQDNRVAAKDDCLLLERDGKLWTFGGDEETGSGGAQDNSVWYYQP